MVLGANLAVACLMPVGAALSTGKMSTAIVAGVVAMGGVLCIGIGLRKLREQLVVPPPHPLAVEQAARNTPGHKAARLSWQLGVAVFPVNFLLGLLMPDSRAVFPLLARLAFVLGLTCGIAALCTASQRDVRRVVVPAVIGIILNTGMLALYALWLVASGIGVRP